MSFRTGTIVSAGRVWIGKNLSFIVVVLCYHSSAMMIKSSYQ